MINRIFNRAKLVSAVSLAIVASGCGIADGALRKPNGGDNAQGTLPGQNADASTTFGSVIDLVMYPPKDYYEYLLASAFDQVDRDQIVNRFAMPQSVWVNFEGGTVPRGFLPNQSYLVCGTAAVIPPLGISQAEQAEVVKKVQELFTAVGATLTISPARPAVGEYTTIYVGGSHVDLGCPEAKGRLAVAPFDPGNVNRSDVGFVFSSAASSPQALAQVIARTAGHSFGLEQVSNPQDIMYALGLNSGATFTVSPLSGGAAVQDGPQILRQVLTTPWITGNLPVNPQASGFPQPPLFLPGIGYVPAGVPVVPGITQLSMLSQLTTALGPSQVLDLTAINPLIRSTFSQATSQTSLAGFERVATVMALVTRAATNPPRKSGFVDGSFEDEKDEGLQGIEAINSVSDKGKGGGTPPTPPSTPSGMLIDGAAIAQFFASQMGAQITLEKLATAAGYANVDAAVKGIQQGLNSGNLKMPAPQEFSDISGVFNLSQTVSTVPVLINGFWSSAYYVKGFSTGLNQSGMNSALKVGYFQAYRRLSSTTSGH